MLLLITVYKHPAGAINNLYCCTTAFTSVQPPSLRFPPFLSLPPYGEKDTQSFDTALPPHVSLFSSLRSQHSWRDHDNMTPGGYHPPRPAPEEPRLSSPSSPPPPPLPGARRVLCSETGRQLLSLPLGRHSSTTAAATRTTADFTLPFPEGSFAPTTTTAANTSTATATSTAELYHGHLRSQATPGSTSSSSRQRSSRRRLERSRYPLRASAGTHYVRAHVGSPPQTVTLIVDTGSFTTAFPCSGCDKCRAGKDQSFWDPRESATALEVTCEECQGLFK